VGIVVSVFSQPLFACAFSSAIAELGSQHFPGSAVGCFHNLLQLAVGPCSGLTTSHSAEVQNLQEQSLLRELQTDSPMACMCRLTTSSRYLSDLSPLGAEQQKKTCTTRQPVKESWTQVSQDRCQATTHALASCQASVLRVQHTTQQQTGPLSPTTWCTSTLQPTHAPRDARLDHTTKHYI
jgi:hypothetical protein